MRGRESIVSSLAVLLLVVPVLALSQDADPKRTLIISGQSGQVPVIVVNGRSYVDLEALARVLNGTLSFAGNQITLSLPGAIATTTSTATAAMPADAPAPAPTSNSGFSRGFLRAAIEKMATLREWHTALASAIQNNYPVAGDCSRRIVIKR